VIATRERTAQTLQDLGFVVYPSRTNFLFISHPSVSARTLFAGLRERGILVRYFDLPRINNCLRVSIGTDDEMDAFLDAVRELI
jgi:histidinol-phosphate aminotransferase